jgi:hypothetical protein
VATSTPATLALLRFRESDASVLPSDDVGALADLNVDAGLSLPPVVPAFTGFGRQFSPGFAVDGQDLVPGTTLATRDVTVRALVAWDLAGQAAYGQPGTVVARGKGGAPAELVSYGLELRVVNAAGAIGELRLWWQDTAGNVRTQLGAQFIAPGPGAFLMLTAVRHWVSSSQVEVRYYVGDQLIGDLVSADGDIGGGTTGTFCVGTRYASGAPGRFLVGVIDELQILNYEVTGEETAATWDRMARLQPRGYRAIRDLLPPGAPISNDPASRIQKLLRIAGHAIGYAAAQAENARRNLLPDRAYGPMLEEWEQSVGETPAAADSVRKRRKRVVSHLSQRAGCSIPGVNATVDDLLAIAPSQLQILAFDNTQREDWSAGLRPERWRADPPAQWSISGGMLRVQAAAAANLLFDGTTRNWLTCLLSVDGTPRWLPGAPSCDAVVKVTPTALPAGAEVGLAFWDWARVNAFLLGVRNNAGTIQVISERFLRGVSQGVTVHATTSLTSHWLQLTQNVPARVLVQDPTGETLQPHAVRWSTTGPTSGFSSASGLPFCYCVNWVGHYARASLASLPSALDVSFDDIAVRAGRGTRPFLWYIYRDPSLPGGPDLVGAGGAINRLKQAHTGAVVITSKSVLCDTQGAGCDSAPMGGF